MAMTDAPIKCSPALSSRLSRNFAAAAITSAIAAPGISFFAFFHNNNFLQMYRFSFSLPKHSVFFITSDAATSRFDSEGQRKWHEQPSPSSWRPRHRRRRIPYAHRANSSCRFCRSTWKESRESCKMPHHWTRGVHSGRLKAIGQIIIQRQMPW